LKKRHVLLILLLLVGAVLFWAYSKKNEPPVAPFARVKRETQPLLRGAGLRRVSQSVVGWSPWCC